MTAADFVQATGADPDVVRDLTAFRDMILEGSTRANLVGPSFRVDFWRRHALDSAQLFHVEQSARRWADVGAGAGFPGVVLAILAKGLRGGEIHLVESQAKRVAFLREVCSALSLPAEVHHTRGEDFHSAPKVDIVTARACAPIDRLLRYTSVFFRRGAQGLFLKGQKLDEELSEARRTWAFRSEILPSLSDPSGRIVRISEVSARG